MYVCMHARTRAGTVVRVALALALLRGPRAGAGARRVPFPPHPYLQCRNAAVPWLFLKAPAFRHARLGGCRRNRRPVFRIFAETLILCFLIPLGHPPDTPSL